MSFGCSGAGGGGLVVLVCFSGIMVAVFMVVVVVVWGVVYSLWLSAWSGGVVRNAEVAVWFVVVPCAKYRAFVSFCVFVMLRRTLYLLCCGGLWVFSGTLEPVRAIGTSSRWW